jgi:hypothetical protein
VVGLAVEVDACRELGFERTSGRISCLIRRCAPSILLTYYQSTLLLFDRLYWGLGMLSIIVIDLN